MDLRRQILVVDDSSDIRDTLACALAAAGYRVTCAENGKEAIDRVEAGLSPDLIILDLTMPVMDGWQLLATRKTHASLATIPVVVLSARRRDEDVDPSVSYLGKHMSLDHLIATVEAQLRPLAPPPPAPSTVPVRA